MLQASAYVTLLFVIGHLTTVGGFLLLWADTAESDWLEVGFAAWLAGIVATGWLAVLLATFGYFSLLGLSLLLLAVGLGLIIVVAWQKRPLSRLIHPHWRPIGHYEIGLLILLLLVSMIYLRPHEYVLGGNDPGSYMNIAANVVHTGSYVTHDDPWFPNLRQHAEVTLREQPPHWQTRYLQFVGWYIDDTDPGRIIPQFFPYHPVWLAVGMALGGFQAGLFVTPLWTLLGLVALYLLVCRLFDRQIALLAALLLAITPTHIYFARYPSTEPLTLLLLFTSLLAFQVLWDGEEKRPYFTQLAWGILGGSSLGAAALTRIDLPLIVGLVVAMLMLRAWQKKWSVGWTAYSLSLAVLSGHALLSMLLISWPYAWNTYGSVVNLLQRTPWLTALLLLVLAVACLLFGLLWRKPDRLRQGLAHLPYQAERLYAKRWLSVGLILLSGYAYFLRPILEPAAIHRSWPTGADAWVINGENWLRMGWYLTPLGLLLATLGAAWLVQAVSWRRFGLFLSIGLLTTAQYVYQIFNTPYHIYTMRRYLPVVIPMLMVYTAVSLFWLYRRQWGWSARLGSGLLALLLIGGLLFQSRYVLPLREYRGALEQLAELQTHLQPGAIIVISEPSEGLFADALGPPLRFLYGHDIATIRQDGPETDAFLDDLVGYAAQQDRPLQLLGVEPVYPALRERFEAEPVAFLSLRLAFLENSYTHFPTTTQTFYYGVELYDLTPQTAVTEPPPLPLTIDVGTLDIVYIEEGLYYKEPLPGPITMRWTAETAVFSLPIAEETAVTLEIRAMIYRPEIVPAAEVLVQLDGQEIGRFVPTQTWQTFTFSGTVRPVNSRSQLIFHTTPFNPASLALSGDNRDLGFLLDAIDISPSPLP
jgi:hypothetical protein